MDSLHTMNLERNSPLKMNIDFVGCTVCSLQSMYSGMTITYARHLALCRKNTGTSKGNNRQI